MPGRNKDRRLSSVSSMGSRNKKICQEAEATPARASTGDIHNDVTLIVHTSTPESTVSPNASTKICHNRKSNVLAELVSTALEYLAGPNSTDSNDSGDDKSESCSCSGCESSSSDSPTSSKSSSSLSSSISSSSSDSSCSDDDVFSTEYTLESDDESFY